MEEHIIQEAYNYATREWMDSGGDPKLLWKQNVQYLLDHINTLETIFTFLKTSSIQYIQKNVEMNKEKQINTIINILDLEYRACIDLATNNYKKNINKN